MVVSRNKHEQAEYVLLAEREAEPAERTVFQIAALSNKQMLALAKLGEDGNGHHAVEVASPAEAAAAPAAEAPAAPAADAAAPAAEAAAPPAEAAKPDGVLRVVNSVTMVAMTAAPTAHRDVGPQGTWVSADGLAIGR